MFSKNTKNLNAKSSSPLMKNQIAICDKMLFAFVLFYSLAIIVDIILALISDGYTTIISFFGTEFDDFRFYLHLDRLDNAANKTFFLPTKYAQAPLFSLFYLFLNSLLNSSPSYGSYDYHTLILNQNVNMFYLLIFAAFFVILGIIISKHTAKMKSQLVGKVFGYTLILSYPLICAVAIGDLSVIGLIFVFLFFSGYKSKNAIIRELSLISLAVSIGFLLFPILFLPFTMKKRSKSIIIKTLVYCVIFTLIPFLIVLVFDKKESAELLPTILSALKKSFILPKHKLDFNTLSVANIAYYPIIRNIFKDKHLFASILYCTTQLVTVVAVLATKTAWKKVFFITYLIVNAPGVSTQAILAFFILPSILLITDEKNRTKVDWIYTGLFALLLTPLPTILYFWQDSLSSWANKNSISFELNLNHILNPIILLILMLSLTIPSFVEKIKTCVAVAKSNEYKTENIDDVLKSKEASI